jgi:hypothetical protein
MPQHRERPGNKVQAFPNQQHNASFTDAPAKQGLSQNQQHNASFSQMPQIKLERLAAKTQVLRNITRASQLLNAPKAVSRKPATPRVLRSAE